MWPVLGEDAAGVVLNLAERDGFEAAGALESEAEASDAGEEIKDAELSHGITLPPLPWTVRSFGGLHHIEKSAAITVDAGISHGGIFGIEFDQDRVTLKAISD